MPTNDIGARLRIRAGVLLAVISLWPLPGALAEANSGQTGRQGGAVESLAGVPLFEARDFMAQLRAATARLAQDDPDGAVRALRALVGRRPDSPHAQLFFATALAASGQTQAALDALARAEALDAATTMAAVRSSAALSRLRADPRFVTPPPGAWRPPGPAVPAAVRDGRALVAEANTRWDDSDQILRAYFALSARPQYPDPRDRPTDRINIALRRMAAQGHAAGNFGDIYDNRDRGHSPFDMSHAPGAAAVVYDAAARAAGVDYGLNDAILFNAVVFGNSSTAHGGGPFWRSLPRAALTTVEGPGQLFRQYAGNHLYVYPEHRDHDPDQGDLMPTNTPYVLISQGSSHSDQPLLRAVAAILAAFRPDVKAFLRERGLVAPTVQMIFRRNLATAPDDETYMSGVAHPAVFRGEDIDLERMIRAANALRVDEIPPMVEMAAIREDRLRSGVDIFGDAFGEVLFDTPSAIARIFRGAPRSRRYVLSAAATIDPNDRPLRFHWRALRGDPASVRVTPLDASGSLAEIVIDWAPDPIPVPGRPEITSRRIDVAVFADNGAQLSAPGFFSVLMPPGETRRYDADGRPLSITYGSPFSVTGYADPLLFPLRGWRDDYIYDADGRLTGWIRDRKGVKEAFTADGERVVDPGAPGRSAASARVVYRAAAGQDGRVTIVETLADP